MWLFSETYVYLPFFSLCFFSFLFSPRGINHFLKLTWTPIFLQILTLCMSMTLALTVKLIIAVAWTCTTDMYTCTRNTFNQTVFCDVSSALGGPLLVWVPQAHLADRQFLQFLSLSKVLRCGTKKEKGAEEEGWGWGCLMSKA